MANGKLTLGKHSGGTLGLVFPDGVSDTEVVLPESGNLSSVDTAVTDNSIARYDGTTGKLQNSGVIIDDNGNIGVGVIPSAWSGGSICAYSLASTSPQMLLGANNYYNSGYKYATTGVVASQMEQYSGAFIWKTAPSGTAGSPITWTNTMILDTTGNLLLTSGTGALGYGVGGIVTQLTSKSTAVTLNKPTGRITMNNEALGDGMTISFVLSNNLMGASDTLTLSIPNLIPNDIFNYIVTYNLYPGGAIIFVTNVSGNILSEAISINFNLHKGASS